MGTGVFRKDSFHGEGKVHWVDCPWIIIYKAVLWRVGDISGYYVPLIKKRLQAERIQEGKREEREDGMKWERGMKEGREAEGGRDKLYRKLDGKGKW